MAGVTKKMAKLTKPRVPRNAPQIGGFPAMRAPILARDLKLLSAGHAPAKHEWIHHRFGFTAVGFVVSGHGTYRVDAGENVVAAGDGVLGTVRAVGIVPAVG